MQQHSKEKRRRRKRKIAISLVKNKNCIACLVYWFCINACDLN